MTPIRLLHVDDEPDIRTVVEIALSMDPVFEVRSCESGADALAAAAEWQPDVMLLDVMMPVMDPRPWLNCGPIPPRPISRLSS